jgi:starvation-inducible DNA-binding protein
MAERMTSTKTTSDTRASSDSKMTASPQRASEVRGRTFRTSVDISEENRTALIQMLNQQLADTFDLYSQTKQAHWNVKGSDFIQLHELYDDLAEALLPHVDTIAERITALGGFALGTARMAAASSRLQDYPQDRVDGMENVEALARCYAELAATTRAGIDFAEEHEDMDTNDLLIDVSRQLDKSLWFLEAHLQGASRR